MSLGGRDLKNAPTVSIEPVIYRSLGGHHIHYATATYVCIDYTGNLSKKVINHSRHVSSGTGILHNEVANR
ncbi:hypothetical protein DPMN_055679 [Dreissena polymorpha]|uniref:Uncharacterized protein n=1 Tax=Dreissena polymorpha TaxID=45954 RepID=A0A9D4HST1_DREPO|nr:hypothetical protein DPMN_055679 [Dreissena polymorpha]